MRIIDRFDEYMKYRGLNDNQVTVNAGLSVGLINNARKGKYDLGKQAVKKILKFYQDLDEVWLLTGRGSMIREDDITSPVNAFSLKTDRQIDMQEIPLYDLTATAGLVAIYNDIVPDPVDHLRVPNLPPVDGAVYVRGDSMAPLLKSGDIIIYKKVELSPDVILWGQIYLLSYTTTGGDTFTVVKYIKRSDKAGYVQLVSANTFYDPADIPATSITALALVKASITFYTME